MLQTKQLVRKVIHVGLCAAIGMTALGFGAAPKAAAATATKAEKVIKTGKSYIGVKYRYGAQAGITTAFDCSSYTQYIFKKNGIELPRTSKQQATKGVKVSKSSLKKGDLVFFKGSSSSSSIGHVGVYAGNNKFLHSSSSNGVKLSSLSSSYWKKKYVTARRVAASS
ncbi:hypothetical protein PAECIP111893_02602 [Paenibacillus plantiphilus]|uniref:NlpC/P60 domain-containing protein n=1 Tax=Paenibacillus plantiphilus TaxID=2905650 RepID=A0ABN8GGS0_9BACL|nr:C40 family peptidase [Paenibacillus plantiphilus]CAH1206753.1 hypothetical protein PAECIP111893_02602 [Paenibacillus plantiphilus]